jgi:5'-nucleotidase
MLAVRDLLGHRPDVVVSGINAGPNLGDDVTYSGTVAGAYEGMLLGLPAVAVSCASYTPTHFASAGEAAVKVVSQVLAHGLPDATMLNVNVPDVPAAGIKGMRVARLGRRHYEDEIVRRLDPRGKPYYWIGGTAPSMEAPEDTDLHAVAEGYVSVTPLQRDITNHAMLEELRRWDF